MKQYPFYPTFFYETFREFLDGISAYGEKPAVCTYDRAGVATVRTYQQLCLDVSSLRKSLQERNLAQKRAVIAGDNSYEWIVTFLAVVSGGGVAICVDVNQDNASIAENVKNADGDYAFTTPEYQNALSGALRMKDSSSVIYLHQNSEDKGRNVQRLISEGGSLRAEEQPRTYNRGEDVCVILFTSGTTSSAKAVALTQRNLLHNVAGATAVFGWGENLYSGLPLFHAYGLNCGMLHALLCGAMFTVSCDIRFIVRDAEKCGADTIFAVPLILDALLKKAEERAAANGNRCFFRKVANQRGGGIRFFRAVHKKSVENLRKACFGNLRVVVTGGAYMNEDVCRIMNNFGIIILPGYGITECSPLISVNRPQFYDISTVGTLLPGYEVKFLDGEILLRGPCVMKEYYNNPEATAEAIDPEGWFHTGDIGCFSKAGNLMITGRKKNLIVFQNGNKVSPERIEAAMLRCPLVAEVCAYAVPFGKSADDVGIAVTVYPNAEETEGLNRVEILNKIQKYVDMLNSEVPVFQQIRIINLRQDPFDRTATGKIKEKAE